MRIALAAARRHSPRAPQKRPAPRQTCHPLTTWTAAPCPVVAAPMLEASIRSAADRVAASNTCGIVAGGTRHRPSPSPGRPRSGNLSPDQTADRAAPSGRSRPNLGQLHGTRPSLGRCWPSASRIRRGQFCGHRLTLGRRLPNSSRSWPHVGRVRPNLASLTGVGSQFAKVSSASALETGLAKIRVRSTRRNLGLERAILRRKFRMSAAQGFDRTTCDPLTPGADALRCVCGGLLGGQRLRRDASSRATASSRLVF